MHERSVSVAQWMACRTRHQNIVGSSHCLSICDCRDNNIERVVYTSVPPSVLNPDVLMGTWSVVMSAESSFLSTGKTIKHCWSNICDLLYKLCLTVWSWHKTLPDNQDSLRNEFGKLQKLFILA